MEIKIQDIHSGGDTNLSILLYIKNHVSVAHEIHNIRSGAATDIQINTYFQNSPDYQKLAARLAAQHDKVVELAKGGGNTHLFEATKLAELEDAEKEFRAGALRLAETFLKIPLRTERLQKARAFFEQGLISAADKVLLEADLLSDQDALIAKMEYLQKRKAQIMEIIAELNQN